MQQNNDPFFIVGCGRSGTTLLSVLLDAHPRLSIPRESHIFSCFGKHFNRYGDFGIEENQNQFLRHLLSDIYFSQWKLDFGIPEIRKNIKDNSIAGCIDAVFSTYAKRLGKLRWGDKTPSHIFHILQIKEHFPNAKIIHLVRDGRDTSESLRRIWFAPTGIYQLAHYWRDRIKVFQDAKTTLEASDFLEVYYEDLVRNTNNVLKEVFDFLKEDPIEVGNIIPETERKKTEHDSKSQIMLQEPISDKKVGIYKKEFTNREIEIFESIASDTLKEYGYELNTSGDARLTILEKIQIFFERIAYRISKMWVNPLYWKAKKQNFLRNISWLFIKPKRKNK